MRANEEKVFNVTEGIVKPIRRKIINRKLYLNNRRYRTSKSVVTLPATDLIQDCIEKTTI